MLLGTLSEYKAWQRVAWERYRACNKMRKLILISILLIAAGCCLAQTTAFVKKEIKKELLVSGDFKDYEKYNLGKVSFMNGTGNNHLKYCVIENKNNKKLFLKSDTLSDALKLKPVFFTTGFEDKPIIIMVEVAAEYSWGQEILLIKNSKVYFPGTLDLAADIYNRTSISEYCHLSLVKNRIFMTFEDVPMYETNNEKSTINGKGLKIEITKDKIKREE